MSYTIEVLTWKSIVFVLGLLAILTLIIIVVPGDLQQEILYWFDMLFGATAGWLIGWQRRTRFSFYKGERAGFENTNDNPI